MKLLILILGANDQTSTNLIENGILPTWGQDVSNDIQIMYYYGDKPKNEIVGNNIFLTTSDAYGIPMFKKTCDAFQLVFDNIDFDIMFRTNVSTYVRTKYLHKILSEQKPIDLFGSAIPSNVVPGTFTGITAVFSKDVIGKILENRNATNPVKEPEDMAIEYLLKNKIFKDSYTYLFKNFKRFDILENSILRLQDPLFFLKHNDEYTFRCKTVNGNRNMDVEKMKQLYKIFNSNI